MTNDLQERDRNSSEWGPKCLIMSWFLNFPGETSRDLERNSHRRRKDHETGCLRPKESKGLETTQRSWVVLVVRDETDEEGYDIVPLTETCHSFSIVTKQKRIRGWESLVSGLRRQRVTKHFQNFLYKTYKKTNKYHSTVKDIVN